MCDKSGVLLVSFKPTIAFYTWRCVRALFTNPGYAMCGANGQPEQLDICATLAHMCSDPLTSTPSLLRQLSNVEPTHLVPRTALPLTDAAACEQRVAGEHSSQLALQFLVRFLGGLRQTASHQYSSQQGSPTAMLPSDTKSANAVVDQCSRTAPASFCNTSDVSAMSAPGKSNTDAHQHDALLQYKGYLCTMAVTRKLTHLAQHVKIATPARERHGVLQMVTFDLASNCLDAYADMPTFGCELQAEDDAFHQCAAEAFTISAEHLMKLHQADACADECFALSIVARVVQRCLTPLPQLRTALLEQWQRGDANRSCC